MITNLMISLNLYLKKNRQRIAKLVNIVNFEDGIILELRETKATTCENYKLCLNQIVYRGCLIEIPANGIRLGIKIELYTCNVRNIFRYVADRLSCFKSMNLRNRITMYADYTMNAPLL